MYFSAFAQPRPELYFDARILFKPLLQEFKAKRTSAIRSADIIMSQATQIDRKKFNEVIKEVIKSDVKLLPTQKRIRIIADGAVSRSVGKMVKSSLKEH